MDIISSEPFDQFFTLQTFAPKLIFEPPKLQLEITGFDFTLRDFLYFNDDSTLSTLPLTRSALCSHLLDRRYLANGCFDKQQRADEDASRINRIMAISG